MTISAFNKAIMRHDNKYIGFFTEPYKTILTIGTTKLKPLTINHQVADLCLKLSWSHFEHVFIQSERLI